MSNTDTDKINGFLPRARFGDLFDALRSSGYRCIGPQVRHGAILYQDIEGPEALPQGWRDHQEPAGYRLEQIDSARQFAWATGPQAIKPNLFAPRELLWSVQRDAKGELDFSPMMPTAEPLALIGVRACDLAALRLQDAHFLDTDQTDPHYRVRRERLFLIAVNCSHPAATCFCVSTGDGPDAERDCDLVLDELDDGFQVNSVSERGAALAAGLNLQPLPAESPRQIEQQRAHARSVQWRRLPGRDLRGLLDTTLDHERWAKVAGRCLSCGNCTSVCPTCFCHSQHDDAKLDGSGSVHYRQWDSCFTADHSYIHGITVRKDTRLRYRQWLTHKLAGWHDQFGRSGCVGCGRCITWCPVGIDLTEEIAALAGGAT